MTEITICYIGGGSADWAMKLMRDLALESGLSGTLCLYDIDRSAAELNRGIGVRLFRHPDSRSHFQVTVASTPEEALNGADIVVLSIEPGPTESRYADLVIPEHYGILQSVGDTTGPGGILRAWRAVPIYLQYAKLIRRYASDAWVVNYTNPMTLCTMALYQGYPDIRAVGCCHEVPSMRTYLASFLSERSESQRIDPSDILIDVTGVNHFTFATGIRAGGTDVIPILAEYASSDEGRSDRTLRSAERRRAEEWFENDHLIALDFLRRFGAYGMAGDRHLAEFVPWYLTSESELERYGAVLTPFEWRRRRSDERANRNPDEEASRLEPSGEEGVPMIRALCGDGSFRTNVNVPNAGQVPWLPMGHPVETYAAVSGGVIRPETPPPPPPGIQGLVRRVVEVQTVTMEACIRRDTEMLLEAILMDPLVSLPVSDAERMLNEMLEYLDKSEPVQERHERSR